jgi:hypothetical protein
MSFAVYGIAILVLIVSIMGGIAVHDHGIKAAQKQADQAALSACQANEALLTSANDELQKSIEPIARDRDYQTGQVKQWKDLAEKAAGVAKMWRDLHEGVKAKLHVAQLEAQAKSRRPTVTQSCQATLNEIDNDSKNYALERKIMFAPPAPDEPAPKIKVTK